MRGAFHHHQAPVLPELPAVWLRLHGGHQLQGVADRDQRSTGLRTVSTAAAPSALIDPMVWVCMPLYVYQSSVLPLCSP